MSEIAITVKSSMALAIIRLSAVWRSVCNVTSPVRMFARFTARLKTWATPLTVYAFLVRAFVKTDTAPSPSEPASERR
jgi:hypothetical protein